MKNLRVLIVDDSREDIEKVASMLQEMGHEVLTAPDGVRGVEVAVNEQPDLVLMDVVMPEINGFQATRELHTNEATSEIPVIIVSHKDEEIDKVWAMKQGARGYLTKGFDKKSLSKIIASTLSGKNKDQG